MTKVLIGLQLARAVILNEIFRAHAQEVAKSNPRLVKYAFPSGYLYL